ncbi:MAG: type III-B CRISPR module RAMP protein Cmr4 [Candidatus Pacebacteria bacterium]|nr:type III-B CRISPR module RAMP protein Cmr4 [Candidatus Paceibacterota bacterium]
MKSNQQFLLGIYTRSPLHVGCGTSVDIVDMPVMRERITNFPVIPSSSLKGVLRQQARDGFESEKSPIVNLLFGNEDDEATKDENGKTKAYAGAVITGEGKLLAFPVRSLKGCFAWITCPTVLRRFQRDWGESFDVPDIGVDACIADDAVASGSTVVLEEYPLEAKNDESRKIVAEAIAKVCNDPVCQAELDKRLVIVSDENFQHFVTACTEIVARIQMNPATRTNEQLFNQENVPCEALFYSVCTILDNHRPDDQSDAGAKFRELFPSDKAFLQIGGDETVGLGLCEVTLTEKGGE